MTILEVVNKILIPVKSNYSMNLFRVFVLLSVILIFIPNSFALLVNVSISENISATNVSGSQVTLEINGNLNIHNPSTQDYIYQYKFEFRDDLSLSISFADSGIISNDNLMTGYDIESNSSLNSDYTISGTIPSSYFNTFQLSGESFLEWYSNEIHFDPPRYMSLTKIQRINENTTNVSQRNVIVEGFNPSQFNVTYEYINLIKTNTSNTNDFPEDENILTSYLNFTLGPSGTFYNVYTDPSSITGDIYWIESRVKANYSITRNVNISQDVVETVSSQSSGSGGSGGGSFDTTFGLNLISFQKFTNKGKISLNDDILVNLQIQNPNPFHISDLIILDAFPKYLKHKDKNEGNSIEFNLETILPYETRIISYPLNYFQESNEEFIFLPQAQLIHKNNSKFSNLISLLNVKEDLEKVLFIEKEIRYIDKGNYKTIIRIRNLGGSKIENLKIIENNFESSKTKQKSWIIPSLDVDETWEISYESSFEEINYNIPEALTTQDVKVYKTVILHNQIISSLKTYSEEETSEKILAILAGMAIFLVFTDILF